MQGHILELRSDGWALEHPLVCRQRSLLDCTLHREIANDFAKGAPLGVAPGRYAVDVQYMDDGTFWNYGLHKEEASDV